MKVNLLFIDKIILFLLSFIVLVDMFNGFFAMEFTKLPISQAYKFLILIIILLRMTSGREIGFIILFFCVLQIGPANGYIKTGDTAVFINDIIVSTKWLIVPISFFYFKQIFLSIDFPILRASLISVVKRAFGFISLNMLLGFLGFGMAFYYHGFSNAIGTKGFIYAGNELTIMVLAIAFIMAAYLYQKEDYKQYAITFVCFLVFSFLITSKTVLGGVVIVYLIPIISSIRLKIRKKWLDYITAFFFLGIPFLIIALYVGITNSGVIDKFQLSLKRNDYDLLTVILSNRNNFVKQGWDVFANEFTWGGKIFGYGQGYHLQLSGHAAEVDFLSLLFASGILGVLFLILILCYWIINANHLKTIRGYIYAKPALIFLWFIIISSNLSGHVFGSGIAGFFIGLCIAMMFYNSHRYSHEPV